MESARELPRGESKEAGKEECIPECVIERYGDKEVGAIFEFGGSDEFLEPDFIQVDMSSMVN